MKRDVQTATMGWTEHYGAFKKLRPTVSNAYSPTDIFRDACRLFSLSLRGAVTTDKEEGAGIESTYASLAGKYGPGGIMKWPAVSAAIIQERKGD